MVPAAFVEVPLAAGFEAGLEAGLEAFFAGAFLVVDAFAALAFAGADVPVTAWISR